MADTARQTAVSASFLSPWRFTIAASLFCLCARYAEAEIPLPSCLGRSKLKPKTKRHVIETESEGFVSLSRPLVAAETAPEATLFDCHTTVSFNKLLKIFCQTV